MVVVVEPTVMEMQLVVDSGSSTEKGLVCGHWTKTTNNAASSEDRNECHCHDRCWVGMKCLVTASLAPKSLGAAKADSYTKQLAETRDIADLDVCCLWD